MALTDRLVSEFTKLGPVTDKEANVAVQVYLELCEVKKYWNVECRYHDGLQVLYLTANRHKSESMSIFVPKSSSDELSFTKMQSYFALCEGSDVKSIFLVLVSADSTCVYYQISDGLQKPTDTGAKHLRLNKREQLDATIRKHRDAISQAALCGTSLTIRDQQDSNQDMP